MDLLMESSTTQAPSNGYRFTSYGLRMRDIVQCTIDLLHWPSTSGFSILSTLAGSRGLYAGTIDGANKDSFARRFDSRKTYG